MLTYSLSKKFLLSTAGLALCGLLTVPVFAQAVTPPAPECTDEDGDGYIALSATLMPDIVPGFNANGDYSVSQWEQYLNAYKNSNLRNPDACPGLNFKRGAEPTRCDAAVLGATSNVYDPARVTVLPTGAAVNPGAYDSPDNGIDEDCNGTDAKLLGGAAAVTGGQKDIGGLTQKVIAWLSRLVLAVSVAVMIWGGVLYATAAGDEMKTSKARKAIIGAVIGLVVGLLAPTIVSMIAANLA